MQEKRLNEIQNYLKNHEICTYEELREYCDVSLSTIKRDIDFLDAEGRLLRIRGGARRLPSDPSFGWHRNSSQLKCSNMNLIWIELQKSLRN